MEKNEYNNTHIGRAVFFNGDPPSWLTTPIRTGYCLLKRYMTGIIIGSSNYGDKIMVQFDQPIWSTKTPNISIDGVNYNTDVNGRGKPGHCAYFWPVQVQLGYPKSIPQSVLDQEYNNRKLLLLIRK